MLSEPIPINHTPMLNRIFHKLPFRLIELAICAVLVVLYLPVWLIHYTYAHMKGQAWLQAFPVLGQGGQCLSLRVAAPLSGGWSARFLSQPCIAHSTLLLAIFSGKLSLVGPAPVALDWRDNQPDRYLSRFQVRPGLIHTFLIRSRVNIAFEEERELALLDASNQGLFARLGLLLRAIPALLLGSDKPQTDLPDHIDLFFMTMANRTRDEAVTEILALVQSARPCRIAFVNPACVNIAMKNDAYRGVLEQSDLIYPDGIGIQIACKLTGRRLKDNLNGTDLFPALVEEMARQKRGLYLLGAREAVCKTLVEKLAERWPELRVCGYRNGYFKPEDEPALAEEINGSGADILLVAMGVPSQEFAIDRLLPMLRVPVTMGVGGLFDFYSGRIARAPLWMREVGLEWLYRLIREPRRLWQRYLIGNFVFMWHLARWRS